MRREARIAEAQARRMYAEEFPKRDAGEVLLAAVADADAVLQKIKQQVEYSGQVKASDLLLLKEWVETTARWSKTVIDLRLDERRLRMSEETGAQVVAFIRRVFADPLLALTPEQQAVADGIAAKHLRAMAAEVGS